MKRIGQFLGLLFLPTLGLAGEEILGCRALPQAVPAWVLDSPEKKLALRLDVESDLEARNLALALEESGNAPSLLLSLWSGAKEPLSPLAKAYGVAPAGAGWISAPLDGVMLRAGQSCFFVVEADLNRGGGHPVDLPSSAHLARVLMRKSEGAQALSFDGKKWSKLDATPLWAVQGPGGASIGNAWLETRTLPVFEGQMQGEAIHLRCESKPLKLRARIRQRGQPKAPLRWFLMHHNYAIHETQPMAEGLLAQPGTAFSDFAWAEAPLKLSATASLPAECFYFALASSAGKAAGDSCADCWEVSAARVLRGLSSSQDLSQGGGAHRDRASSSKDGKHWEDDFDSDLHLEFVSEACPPMKAPVPLPRPPLLPKSKP